MRAHRGYPEDGLWLPRVLLQSRVLLTSAFVVTVGLGILAATSPRWLSQIEAPLRDWIRGDGDAELPSQIVTQLGSPNLAIVVAVGGAVMLWRRCRTSAAVLLGLVSASVATDILVKLAVDRPRPGGAVVSTALGSFPSGHVIHAVAIFGFIPFLVWAMTGSRKVLRSGSAVFGVTVLAVSVSRVRLGAHWPSDIVASFFIGVLLLLAAARVLMSRRAVRWCDAFGTHPVASGSLDDE